MEITHSVSPNQQSLFTSCEKNNIFRLNSRPKTFKNFNVHIIIFLFIVLHMHCMPLLPVCGLLPSRLNDENTQHVHWNEMWFGDIYIYYVDSCIRFFSWQYRHFAWQRQIVVVCQVTTSSFSDFQWSFATGSANDSLYVFVGVCFRLCDRAGMVIRFHKLKKNNTLLIRFKQADESTATLTALWGVGCSFTSCVLSLMLMSSC